MRSNTSFDPAAQVYHRSRLLPEEAERSLILPLVDVFESDAPRILDLGAGTGRFAGPLARRTGWPVCALDLAPKMLRQIHAEYQNLALQCVCADAMRLPFHSERFSGIIVSAMLHFVADWRAVMAEADRVLRRGGTLMVLLGRVYESDPPVRRILYELRRRLGQAPTAMPGIEEIQQLLSARGYRYEEIAPIYAEQDSTPRQALEEIAADAFPVTWGLAPDTRSAVLGQAATWAGQQWPDLDEPVTATMSWRWHCFIAPPAAPAQPAQQQRKTL